MSTQPALEAFRTGFITGVSIDRSTCMLPYSESDAGLIWYEIFPGIGHISSPFISPRLNVSSSQPILSLSEEHCVSYSLKPVDISISRPSCQSLGATETPFIYSSNNSEILTLFYLGPYSSHCLFRFHTRF